MTGVTRIWTEIDFDRDGKQVGWLQLPHSVTRSAYGNISIPIAVIKNREGPTALLTAGNHGDEYEGQIVLSRLIRELSPSAMRGRVIILPAMNLPAAMAGTRVSPIDDGNLHRSFPGDPDSGPTGAIAHYVDSVLYPMADIHHDLHAGGSSLDYVPFASMRLGSDADLNERSLAALRAFGAPWGMIWNFTYDDRLASAAAMKHGFVSLGGEFGGGGSVSIHGIGVVTDGVWRLLAHTGIVEASAAPPVTEHSRLVEVKGRDYYVYVDEPGLFEPLVELGEAVQAGQICGYVHFVDNPAREPVACPFKVSGILVCKRHLGRVERGDCVAHLATEWQG